MSAVATQKPGGAEAVQMTFPGVFSREYARSRLGQRFAPTESVPMKQDYVGNDFQSQYHRQKYEDAKRSVMNGVRQTRDSTNRALVSHMGFFGMPKAVRSQRRLGTDKGVGVGANIPYYKGDEYFGGMLEGGVLGSIQGQKYAKDVLAKRVAQLNALDASSFDAGVVNADSRLPPDGAFSEQSKIELSLAFNALQGYVESGNISAITTDAIKRFLVLFFRYFSLPESDVDIDEYQTTLISLIRSSDSLFQNETDDLRETARIAELDWGGEEEPQAQERTSQRNTTLNVKLVTILEQCLRYLNEMETKGQFLQPKDRQALSKSLIKKLKFGAIMGKDDIMAVISSVAEAKGENESVVPGALGGDTARMRQVEMDARSNSRFTSSSREQVAPFQDDEVARFRDTKTPREIFGEQGGTGLRPQRGFAGDREIEGVIDTTYQPEAMEMNPAMIALRSGMEGVETGMVGEYTREYLESVPLTELYNMVDVANLNAETYTEEYERSQNPQNRDMALQQLAESDALQSYIAERQAREQTQIERSVPRSRRRR